MDYLYINIDCLNGHEAAIIFKSEKKAKAAAHFAVERCGIRKVIRYRISGIGNIGWYITCDIEETRNWEYIETIEGEQ